MFMSIGIDINDAWELGRGCELMVEALHGSGVKFTGFDRTWSFGTMWEDFVALPEKDYYTELNRWIDAHSLKVGDKVRILRSPTLEDMEGWECDWDERLDKYVGQVGIVDFYYGDNDIIVTFPDGEEVFVPYAVLEKVQRKTYLDVLTELEGLGITTVSTTMQGNRITIEGVFR